MITTVVENRRFAKSQKDLSYGCWNYPVRIILDHTDKRHCIASKRIKYLVNVYC